MYKSPYCRHLWYSPSLFETNSIGSKRAKRKQKAHNGDFYNFIYIFVAAARQPLNRLGNINLPRMKHKVLRPFIPGVIVY